MASTDTDAHGATLHTDRAPARGDRYHWRLIATGFCFLVFGVGAAIMSVVLPVTRWLPGKQRQRRARRLIQFAFRAFVHLMRAVGVMTLELRGLERLGRPGQLIIANHPTLIDAVVLLGFMPGAANCVAKAALHRSLLTRGAVAAVRYVGNEPTDEMIVQASVALNTGDALVMFPEGTRTRPGEPTAFHRGAANIALRAARTLTPVFIACDPPTLSKAQPWYRIPPRRFHVRVVVGADVDLQPYRSAPLPKGSRALNRELQALFERELSIY